MDSEIEYQHNDPCVLWYWNDWSGGTIAMSRHLKGCYMDLLVAQFNNGPLSLDEIKTVLGSDFGQTWPTLQKKFSTNEKGLFYNKRLLFEKLRRSKYVSSRKKNLNRSPHMEIEMEIENIELKKVWDEWKVYRAEIKHPLKPTTERMQLEKIMKFTPEEAIAMLRQSMENGWTGIFKVNGTKIQPKQSVKERDWTKL